MTIKINQYNYEHYFLMYIDNELSEQEKAEVNEFILLNPDFAKKLKDLHKTKIHPSPFVYENKFSLYKLSELDEQCINYLDNEMSQVEKNEFEKILTTHPAAQSNLDQWRKTILTEEAADKIETSFKNKLYKKEATVKPLWERISTNQWASVAAILLVVIGAGIYQQSNINISLQSNTNITNNGLHESVQLNNADTNPKSATIINAYDKKSSSQLHANISHSKINSVTPTKIFNKKIQFEKIIEFTHNEVTAIAQLQKNEINANLTSIENVTQINKSTISDLQNEISNDLDANTSNSILYNTIDTEEEDRTINIANLEIDGAKFRAISRKITTLFKRNKPENDKYK